MPSFSYLLSNSFHLILRPHPTKAMDHTVNICTIAIKRQVATVSMFYESIRTTRGGGGGGRGLPGLFNKALHLREIDRRFACAELVVTQGLL